MVENEIRQPIHSYGEVMKAIDKLTEEEKKFVFKQMDVSQIVQIVDTQKNVDEYCELLDVYAKTYAWAKEIVRNIYKNMNMPTDEVEDIVCDYKKLNVDQKKAIALKLLNDSTFQKDCCEVLTQDFERIAKKNPTIKLLDDLLGFSKYYKKCIKLGIGCDHKYEV